MAEAKTIDEIAQAYDSPPGWYDVRVRIYKAEPDEPEESAPQFETVPAAPGTNPVRRLWQAFVAGTGQWK